MKRKILWPAGWLLLFGVTFAAYGVSAYNWSANNSDETVCPGRITCPITGEKVCRDNCPLIDSSRADCPGRIECPLTRELVCRDKCPLAAKTSEQKVEADLPPCCRGKK